MAYTKTPAQAHRTLSDRLMRQAECHLADGDRLKASAEAWESVYHSLKDVSLRHGLPYGTMTDAYEAVFDLSQEVGGRRLEVLFDAACILEWNSCEDFLDTDFVARDIERVKELLDLIKQADRQMANSA